MVPEHLTLPRSPFEVIDSYLAQRRAPERAVLAEFGSFVGYSCVRMAWRAGELLGGREGTANTPKDHVRSTVMPATEESRIFFKHSYSTCLPLQSRKSQLRAPASLVSSQLLQGGVRGGAQVVSFESDAVLVLVARHVVALAGLSQCVEIMPGMAHDALDRLVEDWGAGRNTDRVQGANYKLFANYCCQALASRVVFRGCLALCLKVVRTLHFWTTVAPASIPTWSTCNVRRRSWDNSWLTTR